MNFLLPIGLLALLTLPLILILHLIRENRRRQVVPSLMLWQNLPQRYDGTRRRLLPLTILLLLHLLAAGLMGVALGQPQIPGTPSEGARHTAIVVDTSTSMAAREGGQTRFGLAREQARALLRELRPGDRATLIAAGTTARVISAGGAGDYAILDAALGRIQPGGTSADLEGALSLAKATLDPQYKRRIVMISDGAIPPLEPQEVNLPFEWRQVGNDQSNRAIIAFAARPWGAKLQVYARIANYSGAPFSTSLRLYSDNEIIGTDAVALSPNGETELTWTLPAEYTALRAELDGADGLPEDDQAFLSIAPARPVEALLVAERPETLQRVLASVPGVNLTTITTADYEAGAIPAADLTIFETFIPQQWPESAVLVINPPPGSPLLQVGEQPTRLNTLRLLQRSTLLDGLSFSGVNFGFVQPVQPPAWATVQLAALNGAEGQAQPTGQTPLILRGRDGDSEVAIWTFDISTGNLPARLAFPLLMARTVRNLTPAAVPSSIPAGGMLNLRPDARATQIQITDPEGARQQLGVQQALALDTLVQPGFYQIEERTNQAILFRGQVGVSAGNALESNLTPQPDPSIIGTADDPGGTPQTQKIDLWPWFVAVALAVLVLEWAYVLR